MKKQMLIFFTGAGISADSGVPTFAEQSGIRDKLTRDFAINHTEEYIKVIRSMKKVCEEAIPNEAHEAIATINCPVITMNIDGLHQKAGSKHVVDVHGRLPSDDEMESKDFRNIMNIPVLYGDRAPKYRDAYELVNSLVYDKSYFVIVGTSFYTGISSELLYTARLRKSNIIIINENASIKVPEIVNKLRQGLNL